MFMQKGICSSHNSVSLEHPVSDQVSSSSTSTTVVRDGHLASDMDTNGFDNRLNTEQYCISNIRDLLIGTQKYTYMHRGPNRLNVLIVSSP